MTDNSAKTLKPIPAIVLAAGFSRRLGRAKQTLLFKGETLVGRSARTAAEAGLWPVFVIVPTEAGFCGPLEAEGYCCLVNSRADEGIASSIRLGADAATAKGAVGVVLMTCDQPALTPEHLRQLVADRARATASLYGGHRGIPAYFTRAEFPALQALRGDQGARVLLQDARAVQDESLAFDVDTEADAFRLESLS